MSNEENDVFSGSVSSQPQIVNVQPAGNLMLVEKSSLPQILGVLVIIFGALSLLSALSNTLTIFVPEDSGALVPPNWIVIGQTITGSLISGATIFGGYHMFNYQKKGIWIALGAIGVGFLNNAVWSLLSVDYIDSQAEGFGAIVAGSSVVCGFLCSAICGLIVLMPLFFANHGME
jgi:hypothetical protein|tara:strand:+ start:172 stop:696 length:525 start_codon:yes stop_codon:yes gene_type:complete